jgi:hypothetical protein
MGNFARAVCKYPRAGPFSARRGEATPNSRSPTTAPELAYDPDLNTKSSVLASPPPTVTFWVSVPSFSCHAFMV